MKVLRNVLGACAITMIFSGSTFAGIMHTGCQSNVAVNSPSLTLEVALNVVLGLIALF
jgi:hypothetical protein